MKKCLECGKELEGVWQKKFCSQSCSASYNNRIYPKRHPLSTPDRYCVYCGNKLDRIQKKRNKFCSSDCFALHRKEEYIKKWLSGEISGSQEKNKTEMSGYIKNYLLEKSFYKCSRCGWNEINPTLGYPVLDIHHKDGKRENNAFENLVVLCPNCHSITENYRALNIGNGKALDKK